MESPGAASKVLDRELMIILAPSRGSETGLNRKTRQGLDPNPLDFIGPWHLLSRSTRLPTADVKRNE